MSKIKEQVQEAYYLLPEGGKSLAANIHGCGVVYFRRIVAGEVKNDDVYYSALNAIKQAAKQIKDSVVKSVNEIEVIAEKIDGSN